MLREFNKEELKVFFFGAYFYLLESRNDSFIRT